MSWLSVMIVTNLQLFAGGFRAVLQHVHNCCILADIYYTCTKPCKQVLSVVILLFNKQVKFHSSCIRLYYELFMFASLNTASWLCSVRKFIQTYIVINRRRTYWQEFNCYGGSFTWPTSNCHMSTWVSCCCKQWLVLW